MQGYTQVPAERGIFYLDRLDKIRQTKIKIYEFTGIVKLLKGGVKFIYLFILLLY